MTLLKAQEILEEDPTIAKHFDAHQISFLHYLGFVRGRKYKNKRRDGARAVYCLEDVQEVVKIKSQLIRS